MNERARSTINIYRTIAGRRKTIAVVPITPNSKRVFKIMSEDCIKLSFVIEIPRAFNVGDFIVDELFGKFYLSETQLPTWDKNTGGYKYELRFDAEYLLWKNHLFMLAENGVRKEANWSLTSALEVHAQQLIDNLDILGFTEYKYIIEDSATDAFKVASISYAGVSILEALKLISDTWKCEWWVVGKDIHFGKMTASGRHKFTPGDNVTDIVVNRSRNTAVTRLYAFGGTKNIPYTYRKKIYFEVTGKYRHSDTEYSIIADKKFTADMFPQAEDFSLATSGSPTKSEPLSGHGYKFTFEGRKWKSRYSAPYNISKLTVRFTAPRIWVSAPTTTGYEGRVWVGIYQKTKLLKEVRSTFRASSIVESSEFSLPEQSLTIDAFELDIAKDDIFYINAEYQYELESAYISHATKAFAAGTIDCVVSSKSASIDIPAVDVNSGAQYFAQINPHNVEKYLSDGSINSAFYYIAIKDQNKDNVSENIDINTIFRLDDEGSLRVPSAFYSEDYENPSAICRIGEMRLRLPQEVGAYIDAEGISTNEVVESAVIFDDIYPCSHFIITEVTAEERTDYTEYEGETAKNDWQWHEYTVKLAFADSEAELAFSADYILPNQTLQLQFLTPQDMNWDNTKRPNGCKLAGMTYDVQFNKGIGSFTIVRNSTYGTLLPNDILAPIVGDPCQLIGYNVRALGQDTIETAEETLLAKAKEYLAAIEDAPFTFDCTLAPSALLAMARNEFVTADGEAFVTADGDILVLESHEYALPQAGDSAEVCHEALPTSKQSRIIGFEMRLDRPYASLKVTVGETEKYSRLAQIEKEITKLK